MSRPPAQRRPRGKRPSLERLERRVLLAGNGLRGEYFDDIHFTNSRITRSDATIQFDWGTAAPHPSLQPDTFAVRWEGQVEAPPVSGSYTFYTQSDDGVRLWVDGQLLVDNWTDHALTEESGTIALTGGRRYSIRMEYYDRTVGAVARLSWSGPGLAKQAVPNAQLFLPDSPASVSFATNQMRVFVEAVAGDTFRISASTAPGAANSTDAVSLSGDASASFHFTPASGTMEVRRGGMPVWTGSVRALSSFGRAGVAGTEVAWNAPPGEILFGLGERFDALNQWGKVVDIWNEDAPGQPDGKTYYTTPVLYSNRNYALFATDNPESQFDLNSRGDGTNRYRRASQAVQFYVAAGASWADLIQKRAALQGAPGAVPDWAWGPWISKNSYETQAEAIAAIQGSLDRGIPVSAIVQEAWKGGSASGDWNNFATDRWPDLNGYFDYVASENIKTLLWQVPVIEPGSPEYATGAANGYFVRRPDGSVSLRDGWFAGWANIDFTNPAAVAWWKQMVRPEVRMGVYGFKADDGESIKPDDVFFDGRRGWQMHNEYSALYHRALAELMAEERPGQGMLWGRSGSLGIEPYPGIWAGDQGAYWSSIHRLIIAGLSASISGMPFWGHDIGGYWDTPSPELYIRWAQFGALSPFMQYHGVTSREPWNFGPQAERVYKQLAQLRMNLRPSLIALGQAARGSGMPLMRPMAIAYPDDARFAYEDQQYMLGPDLLVAPVFHEGATSRLVKFPTGRWYHALTGRAHTGPADVNVPIGLEELPLFLREGATISLELAPGMLLGQWMSGVPTRPLTVARPAVTDATFEWTATAKRLRFTFDQDLGLLPSLSDLTVRRVSDGALIAPTGATYNPAAQTLTYTLPASLDDGRYTATLRAASAGNAAGITLTADASHSFGILPPVIAGTAGADQYHLRLDAGTMLQVWLGEVSGDPTYIAPASAVTSLRFDAIGGDDVLTLDFSGGSPVPSGGITFDGGSGNDTLVLKNAASAPLAFLGGDGEQTIRVEGGSFTLASDLATNSPRTKLIVSDGATVTLAASQRFTDVTTADGGRIDLKENLLVIDGGSVGVATSGIYDGIQGLVQSGYADGAWTGDGIISSSAAAVSAGQASTNIGVATGAQIDASLSTAGATALFGGQTITGSSTVAMYTYGGDANLDGFVSGDDYTAIDFAIAVPNASGWVNGDFNYDGFVSGDDYTVIDFNIAAQGMPFATSPTVVAVPKPTIDAGLVVAASGPQTTRSDGEAFLCGASGFTNRVPQFDRLVKADDDAAIELSRSAGAADLLASIRLRPREGAKKLH